jgi:predicted DNA-binding transcriptional regulator AlpA
VITVPLYVFIFAYELYVLGSKTMNIMKRALTEVETSEYISMSRSFLRQSRMEVNQLKEDKTSAPKHIKIGRAVRYLKEDLDRWLDSFTEQNHFHQEGGAL